MNIAELFVRVRGDTSDVTSKLRGAGQAVDEFGNKVNKASAAEEGHKLSLGRVERALGTYVGHALGANAVTEQLSTAFGAFAVGGGVVTGVLLGVGAVVAVYEKLTEGTRKATEESDKLAKSLLDQAKAQHESSIAGRAEIVNQMNDRLAAAKSETGAGFFSQLLQGMAPGGQSMNAMTSGDIAAHTQKVADAATEAQVAVNDLGMAIAHLLGPPKEATKAMTFQFNELRDAADKVYKEMNDEKKNWWKSFIDSGNQALTLAQQIQLAVNAAGPSLVESFQSAITTTVPKVDISPDVKIAGDQAKKINDAAEKHTQQLHDAIWGAATQSASIIVSALNIGGGGRNSSLGGALGSTAGFAIGFAFGGGPIGGAIGSTIGQVAGSLIGGLFDHKKAVDRNTDALNRLNSSLNEPTGFKAQYYEDRFSVARQVYRSLTDTARQEASRGGSIGFQMAGA